jgi:hypothetical protein
VKNSIFLFISFFLFSSILYGQTTGPNPFINPAGYYSLDSKTTVNNGETYGKFGTLKVKLLDSNMIVVDFYICKGAPDYNSGSFEDTLLYKNGIAARTTIDDNSCIITFNFNTLGGVTLDEKAKDINQGCGFGSGVTANGFYKRIIEQNPTIGH